MDDAVSFVIPLNPVTASRARTLPGRPGYYLLTYDRFRKEAAELLPGILANLPSFGDSPVEVYYEFICKRPKRPTRSYPRGDYDNYSKAVSDALTKAGLWNDDDQVVAAHERKRYANKGEEPCIRVTVLPVELD